MIRHRLEQGMGVTLGRPPLFPKKTEREVIPVVSFIGRSNSGKTTFLERLVKELKLRGYRVGVVKHTPHSFDIDHPRKDTKRLAQAGSDMVVISSPDRVALIERVDTELTLSQLLKFFEGTVDILLTEGYKNEDTDKILILSAKQEEGPPFYKGKLLATVHARLSPLGIPQFDCDDVIGIADLLVEKLIGTFSRMPEDFSKLDTPASRNHVHPSDKFEKLLAESVVIH